MPQRVGQDVVTQKQDEGCYRHAHAYFTNQRGQPVELLVQGSLHTRGLCRCACHLTYLRMVAHCCHHSPAVSVHYERRAQHHILGISFARLGMGSRRPARVWPVGIHHLGGQHLTRQRRLVDLQVNSLYQFAVGRHLVARFEHYHVAHHHIAAGNLLHPSLSHHFHGLFFVHLCQHIEFLGSVALEIKAHGSGKEDGQDDADGLHKVVLNKGQRQRDGRGYE